MSGIGMPLPHRERKSNKPKDLQGHGNSRVDIGGEWTLEFGASEIECICRMLRSLAQALQEIS